jgi:hypothetical protein
MRRGLKRADMIQPPSNYILPDDARQLGFHDDDLDGVRDLTAIGPDRFFDPSSRRARGGLNSYRASAMNEDPQTLSGNKITHAVGYANTAFFYFSEENRAAPLAHKHSDSFIPGGWFVSDKDEPIRVVERVKDGKTWFEISINTRYADKSRDVLTTMVLYEMQAYLSKREGRFDGDDKLRGLILVAGYLDLYEEYGDKIDDMLQGFAKKYGFEGKIDYDTLWKAMKKDGEHGTAAPAAIQYLKDKGIRGPA